MKFTCSQQALSKALNTVSKAVTTRTTIPILKGILLTAKDGQLKLTGYDLEIGIETYTQAEVIQEGDHIKIFVVDLRAIVASSRSKFLTPASMV